MIDFEVSIFDKVYQHVSHLFASGKFVSVYTPSPTAYPAGSLVELTNNTVNKRQSSTPIENYARIMYQLDVYALSKAEARSVFKEVDDYMIALGFTKVGGDLTDNVSNINVFRYIGRYEAEVDREGNIYRIS